MSIATLKLTKNEEGKFDLHIDLLSDGDALPFEHEEDHRALVKKVLEGSGLEEGDVSSVEVSRTPTEKSSKEEEKETPVPQGLKLR